MTARRLWALPLVPVYAFVLWLVRLLRRMGWLETRKLGWPVVSIGSLSTGGAGKTPVVMALALLLSEHGWTVDVLSRGYGRDGDPATAGLVDPDLLDAASRFGDEPTLIAQTTGVPVWVCADRYTGGQCAESFADHDRWDWERDVLIPAHELQRVHLLDDGFQHGRLARDLEVVLLTAQDITDHLLPAGNLREPLSALARADVIVMREDEAPAVTAWAAPYITKGNARTWLFRRDLDLPEPTVSILSGDPCYVVGARPMMFCGIARPNRFADELAAAGCPVADRVLFRDHHRYTLQDVHELAQRAERLSLTGFITTEKDAVKLTPAMRERLEQVGPLMIVALLWKFVEPERVLADIEAAVSTVPRPRPTEVTPE